MAKIVYLTLIGLLLFWAVLLGAAVRKRRYCPHLLNPLATKIFWLATFLFINPLLMILYAVFGLFRNPDRRPIPLVVAVAIVIILAGFAVNIPGVTHLWMQPLIARNPDPESGFKAHAAVIESSNSTSRSTSSASSDNSRLALSRIEIVAGEHPLLQMVAAQLAEKFRDYPGVKEVGVWHGRSSPDESTLHPDVFIVLQLKQFTENHIPYLLTLDAELTATVSRELLPGRSHHFGRYNPPQLKFDMDIDIRHSSKTTGYESQRYGLASQNLAEQLYDQITTQTDDWREKHGLLPELPAAVYGRHSPAPLPEVFARFEPVRLHSAADLLLHRRAVWEFTLAEGTAAERLEDLHQKLLDAGWRSNSSHFNEQTAYFRVHKDERVIAAHKVREEQTRTSPGITWTLSGDEGIPYPEEARQSPPQPPNPMDRVAVNDAMQFSDAELRQALDAVLAEEDPDKAILFERMYTDEQKQRMIALIEASPAKDAEEWVHLAEYYNRNDADPNRAKEALLRAHALSWADGINAPAAGRVKQAAKRLEMEDITKAPPAPQALMEAGFRQIARDTATFTETYALGERARFFTVQENGDIEASIVYPQRSADEPPQYEFVHLTRDAHSSGRGSQGGWKAPGGILWKSSSIAFGSSNPDGIRLVCTVQIDEGAEVYTVHGEVYKEQAPQADP